jgi:hypothetical protein
LIALALTLCSDVSQHEADGGEFQEREGIAVEIFPVFGEAAATVEPAKNARALRLRFSQSLARRRQRLSQPIA